CVSGCTGSFVVDQSENVNIPVTGGVELHFTYHVLGPVQPCIDGGGTERSAKNYVEFTLDDGMQYHACGPSVHISGCHATPGRTPTLPQPQLQGPRPIVQRTPGRLLTRPRVPTPKRLP